MPIADAIEEVDPDVVDVQHEYGIFASTAASSICSLKSAVEGEQ